MRVFFWFGFGVWAIASLALLMGNAVGDPLDRWSGEVGIVVGLTMAGPLFAAMVGGAYTFWLAIRQHTRDRFGFVVPLGAGLLYFPIVLAILQVVTEANVVLLPITILGIPILLAELSIRVERIGSARLGSGQN